MVQPFLHRSPVRFVSLLALTYLALAPLKGITQAAAQAPAPPRGLPPVAAQVPVAPPTAAPAPSAPAGTPPTAAAAAAVEKDPLPDEVKTIVTHHTLTAHSVTFGYTATVGFLPIRSPAGETEARMFFTAYTRDTVAGDHARPLLFAFNGGPGSASLWLHMGAAGPKRVKLKEDGSLPAPPYVLVDNESTWLDKTDLVFIDPIGTGFSRAMKPELGPKFWSVNGDVSSIGQFIRTYLTRKRRWNSPLFLAGESYGTTRAAGLSSWLLDHGIALNGVILMSSVLNFNTLSTFRTNDTAFTLFLPSYAAIAWFHHKLPAQAGGKTIALSQVLDEATQWAQHDYPAILAQGDALTPKERDAALNKMAALTGLDRGFLDRSNLRVGPDTFEAELLGDHKRILGRYDARFLGTPANAASTDTDYDPSYSAVVTPFTMLFNAYMANDLGYQTESPYFVLGEGITGRWDFGPGGERDLNVSSELRSTLVQNPYTKLFVAAGHYDLATPYFAARRTVNTLGLEPPIRANVTFAEYDAGHMMYIDTPSRHKLSADLTAWFTSALGEDAAAH